jgi:hypothetical protein
VDSHRTSTFTKVSHVLAKMPTTIVWDSLCTLSLQLQCTRQVDWVETLILQFKQEVSSNHNNKRQDTRFTLKFSGATKACLRPHCWVSYKKVSGFVPTPTSSQENQRSSLSVFTSFTRAIQTSRCSTTTDWEPRATSIHLGAQAPRITNPNHKIEGEPKIWISCSLAL